MTEIKFNTGVIRPLECFREAWELIKNDYWFLLLVIVVGGLISSASVYILLGAAACGIFNCFLRVVDGEKVSFEDLLKGFTFFLRALVVAVFIVVPMLILYGIIYIPPLIAIASNPNITAEELLNILIASAVIDAVFAVFMVCLHTLLMFSFPLIVDKNLSALSAMKLSARAVWANLSGVAGLFAIGFLLTLAGMLIFCLGIFFTLPLIVGANTLAFRKVFPANAGANNYGSF